MYARCPAKSLWPSVLEIRAATCGETKRESSVRWRSTAWSGLVGEGLNKRDVVVGERLRLTAHDDDHADQVVLDHDRDPEHRSEEARSGIGVIRVCEDVRNLDGLSLEGRPARRRRPVDGMGML
jgi:hypothetical protein